MWEGGAGVVIRTNLEKQPITTSANVSEIASSLPQTRYQYSKSCKITIENITFTSFSLRPKDLPKDPDNLQHNSSQIPTLDEYRYSLLEWTKKKVNKFQKVYTHTHTWVNKVVLLWCSLIGRFKITKMIICPNIISNIYAITQKNPCMKNFTRISFTYSPKSRTFPQERSYKQILLIFLWFGSIYIIGEKFLKIHDMAFFFISQY